MRKHRTEKGLESGLEPFNGALNPCALSVSRWSVNTNGVLRPMVRQHGKKPLLQVVNVTLPFALGLVMVVHVSMPLHLLVLLPCCATCV